MKLLDGKQTSAAIKVEIADAVSKIKDSRKTCAALSCDSCGN